MPRSGFRRARCWGPGRPVRFLEQARPPAAELAVQQAGRFAPGAPSSRAPILAAAAAWRARPPEASVRWAQALPPVAEHAVERPAPEESPDAEVVAARRDEVVAALPAAAAVALRDAAAGAEPAERAAVVLPAAPEELLSGLAWAAAWACRQDPLPPWPAPPPSAPTARVMALSPIAGPQGLWSQVALVASSSWRLGSSWEFLEGIWGQGSLQKNPRRDWSTRLRDQRPRDQRTSVRPDCGGFHTGTRIYFDRDIIRTRACSGRIHRELQTGNWIGRWRGARPPDAF